MCLCVFGCVLVSVYVFVVSLQVFVFACLRVFVYACVIAYLTECF